MAIPEGRETGVRKLSPQGSHRNRGATVSQQDVALVGRKRKRRCSGVDQGTDQAPDVALRRRGDVGPGAHVSTGGRTTGPGSRRSRRFTNARGDQQRMRFRTGLHRDEVQRIDGGRPTRVVAHISIPNARLLRFKENVGPADSTLTGNPALEHRRLARSIEQCKTSRRKESSSAPQAC